MFGVARGGQRRMGGTHDTAMELGLRRWFPAPSRERERDIVDVLGYLIEVERDEMRGQAIDVAEPGVLDRAFRDRSPVRHRLLASSARAASRRASASASASIRCPA